MFPVLTEAEIVRVGRFGVVRRFERGKRLYGAGEPSPGMFVVVAMMACCGSVAQAPLAVMIVVAEMTGSFSVLPGAMITVGIAYLLISRTNVSIYSAQRLNRWTA